MIKILLCCGGGASSSALSRRVQKEILEKDLQDKLKIDYEAFILAGDKLKDVDIILACPHLRLSVERFINKYPEVSIPIYILPPKIYGTMNVDAILKDAEDILALYKANPHNPCSFPEEANILHVKRSIAHRDYIKKSLPL